MLDGRDCISKRRPQIIVEMTFSMTSSLHNQIYLYLNRWGRTGGKHETNKVEFQLKEAFYHSDDIFTNVQNIKHIQILIQMKVIMIIWIFSMGQKWTDMAPKMDGQENFEKVNRVCLRLSMVDLSVGRLLSRYPTST